MTGSSAVNEKSLRTGVCSLKCHIEHMMLSKWKGTKRLKKLNEGSYSVHFSVWCIYYGAKIMGLFQPPIRLYELIFASVLLLKVKVQRLLRKRNVVCTY